MGRIPAIPGATPKHCDQAQRETPGRVNPRITCNTSPKPPNLPGHVRAGWLTRGAWVLSSTSLHPQHRSRIIPSALPLVWLDQWKPSSPTVTWRLRPATPTTTLSVLSSRPWMVTVRLLTSPPTK